ncbi:MAG: hypothetical protein KDE27_03455, partial [Planctomycetes bacterium]|nr:hypothetical protein [Planctomycetota bacterium]
MHACRIRTIAPAAILLATFVAGLAGGCAPEPERIPGAAASTGAAAASCCAEEHVELAPLPADASDKERWLRRIHDEAPDVASNVFLSTRYLDD